MKVGVCKVKTRPAAADDLTIVRLFLSPPAPHHPSHTMHAATTLRHAACAARPSHTRRSIATRAGRRDDAPSPPRAARDSSTDLLPRRDPGSFPSPNLVSALERLSFELLEGAETGPPAPEGEVVAFDPLRDGPARYLGYSNECG